MGSIGSTGRLGSFSGDINPSGLDLNRCEILRELGMFKAADAASFQQGQMLSFDANQELVLADGADVYGVAKRNKVTLNTSAVTFEAVTAGNGTVSSLDHANVSNVVVRDTVDVFTSGSVIPAASNYTLSAVNGTLTWANPPAGTNAPTAGDTVFVTYTWAMTDADYRFKGRNFFNFVDDVTISDGRVNVILAPATLFTTMYDTSRDYALTGTGANLYVGGNTGGLEGLFTNDATEGTYVGRVISLPTQEDPFLGLSFTNLPEEAV